MEDPYKRASSSEWRTLYTGFLKWMVTTKKRLPLSQGVRNRAHWLSWHPGVRQGASGTPGDLPEYLILTLQAGLCRVGPNLSLASRGTKMDSILNKKINSAVGEAGVEVDAELGLQRSSTNPPLQTAPTEKNMFKIKKWS